jgi:hypothetical protein
VIGNRADIQHKLEQELAQRPSPSELVNKGILNGELGDAYQQTSSS